MSSPNATTEADDAPDQDPTRGSGRRSPEQPSRSSQRSLSEMVGPLFRSERAMFTVVVVAALYWAITLGRLIVLRQNRFGTFDFDTGIQDQLIWQLAHFRGFSTVRGVPFFGNHASFAFFFLAPFTWIGAGPNAWHVLNAVLLASCAPILYLIARDRFGRPWMSAAVGLAWLAQPSVQWWVQEGFHAECMALPFLFATWLFGQRIVQRMDESVDIPRRLWWAFGGSFFATIIWKEDLALALVGMGLVWVIRRKWRLGVPVVVAAALWFVIFGAFMVPKVAGGTVYGGIYGDLGDTPTQVVTNSVIHPSRLVDRWADNDALAYSSRLHQSFGYVAVLSPVTWLIGAPQWFVDISSTADFTWSDKFHYQALPTAALAISFIEAAWWLSRRRRWLGEAAVVLGLCAAVWTGSAHGAGPWSPDNYRAGYWPLTEPANQSAKEAAVRLIRPGDGVSADYLMVPHLTHREFIYTFPNPWRNSNYGISPDDRGDPGAVDWIVMDTALLNGETRELYESIKASGEFQVAMQADGVEVLRRIHPPGRGTAPIATR
ncbi:MAG TPA: DUF2079 domain-containing protein [Acidimicrobiales bacterium]|nr:DUF2079 domain-containing protein [Acidimicrobiales bacterium]